MKLSIKLLIFSAFMSPVILAQNVREFRDNFTTNTGIYGYVEVVTKPSTYGFASVQIQQKRIVVEGVRAEGWDKLNEYGISFPFECSNCYCYASGSVQMNVDWWGSGYAPQANFSQAGSIHKLDYTIHRAIFSEQDVLKHNKERAKNGYSDWDRYGQVNILRISGVAGGDLGKITRALKQIKMDSEKVEDPGEIVLQTTSSDSDSDSSSNSSVSEASIEESSSTSSSEDELNAKIESDRYTHILVTDAIKNGDYDKAADIMKDNPGLYTPQQVQNLYNTAASESVINLVDLLFFSEPDWEAIKKSRKLYAEAEVKREEELKKVVVSKKINNAKIAKKRSFYGVQDQDGNWLIPAKYFSIKLIKETETEVKYEVVTKSLNTSYRTLKK